jgi:hypothetical protein
MEFLGLEGKVEHKLETFGHIPLPDKSRGDPVAQICVLKATAKDLTEVEYSH